MTNHSSPKAAIAFDPNDGFDHLAGVLGGRLIGLSELVQVDPFETGYEMTPRTNAEED